MLAASANDQFNVCLVGVAQNLDSRISWEFPVILAECSNDSIAQKQGHISYHGDLFCAVSQLQIRITAMLV